MKPDTYFRHSGRPPCTANATASNASDSPHESSSADLPEALRTTAEFCEPRTKSGTSLLGADGLPSSKDITKEPNTCTANATDASGSAEPPFDSSAETEGAPQTLTPSPQPKHGEITSHGASSAQPKKRGRPRKSP